MANPTWPKQPDSGKLRMVGGLGPVYGRADGAAVVPDAGGDIGLTDGLVAVANGDITMALEPQMWCQEFIDFNGLFLVADKGATFVNQPGSPWCVELADSTSPVAARKADSASGALELKLSSTSEVAEVTLFWGDELNINSNQGPIIQTRLQYQTQPAAADSLSWGFTNNQNALIDSTTNNAIFKVAGANNNLLVETDNATTNDDDNDTSVDMTAGTYIETMISMNPIHGASATDVRFFYRTTLGGQWTRVLDETTFAYGANTTMQPMFQVEKTTGATTPDMLIDYINVMWLRV